MSQNIILFQLKLVRSMSDFASSSEQRGMRQIRTNLRYSERWQEERGEVRKNGL